MSTPYKICQNCGVHLDPGEPCDCQGPRTLHTDKEAAERAIIRPERDARGGADRVATRPPIEYASRR